jgi:hypothetical protein
VAVSQARKSASTNKRRGDESAVVAAIERYRRDLERAPLATRTKDAYAQHVRAYGAWLVGQGGGDDALSDPRARDYAARDFKRHLKVERGWKPSSVTLALAAVDHFNRFLGLGPANVKREPLSQAAPRALSEGEQRDLIRAAEASRPRNLVSRGGPGLSSPRMRDDRGVPRRRHQDLSRTARAGSCESATATPST